MVAQLPVKELVVGSSPTTGAIDNIANFRFSKKVGFSFFEGGNEKIQGVQKFSNLSANTCFTEQLCQSCFIVEVQR